MAGKIIADIIQAPYDSIRMNVGNVTVLTANSSGLTYLPTSNVNLNISGGFDFTANNLTVSQTLTANTLVMSSGIKFPGTQVSSGDANTLDDYEEGTWTPTVYHESSDNSTWTLKNGYYTKVGRLVTCHFVCDAGNSGTASTQLYLKGLPFVTGTFSGAVTYGIYATNGTVKVGNILHTSSGVSVMQLYNGGQSVIDQQSYVSGTIVYHTS